MFCLELILRVTWNKSIISVLLLRKELHLKPAKRLELTKVTLNNYACKTWEQSFVLVVVLVVAESYREEGTS